MAVFRHASQGVTVRNFWLCVRHFKNVKQISVGISPSIGASFEGSILGLYFVPAWLPNGTTSDVVILLMPISQNLTKHILLSNVNHAKVNRFTN